MTFNIVNFIDQPGFPGVEAYPHVTFAFVDFTLPKSGDPGSDRVVQHTTDPGVLPIGNLSTAFIIGSKSILAWQMVADQLLGGTFQIELSYDGTNFEFWRSYPIHGSAGTLSGEANIELFGWMARFTVINSDPVNSQDFNGQVQLKGF